MKINNISIIAVLCIFTLFSMSANAAPTSAGLSLVLEYKNNSIVTGIHNATVSLSNENCTSGVFYNETFNNSIINGRANITLRNLNVTYNADYFLCIYIDGNLTNENNSIRTKVGQGVINASSLNSTDNYTVNNLNITGIVYGTSLPNFTTLADYVNTTSLYSNFSTYANFSMANITGSGTTNYLARWANATRLNDSSIQDDGSLVTIGLNTLINGNLTVIGGMLNATVTNQYLNGSFLPSLHNVFDIGSTTLYWQNIYGTNLYQNGNAVLDNTSSVVSYADFYGNLSYYVNYTNLANYVNYSHLANYVNFTHLATYANQSYVPNLSTTTCGAGQAVTDINNATGVVTCAAVSSLGNVTGSGATRRLALWYNASELNSTANMTWSELTGLEVDGIVKIDTDGNSSLVIDSGGADYSCLNLTETNLFGFSLCNDGAGVNRFVISNLSSDIEYFIIDRQSGNISITQNLSVDGDINIYKNLTVSGITNTTGLVLPTGAQADWVLFSTANGTGYWKSAALGNISGSGEGGNLTRWFNTSQLNASTIWENGSQINFSLPLISTNYINSTSDINSTRLYASDHLVAGNEVYSSFLVGNIIGGIDMRASPWYFSGVDVDFSGSVNVYDNLTVGVMTNTTGFVMPTGAVAGYVLSSDVNGNASWTGGFVNTTTLYNNLSTYINSTDVFGNLSNYANFTHMITYANKSYVPNLSSKTCGGTDKVSAIDNATGIVTCTADAGGGGSGNVTGSGTAEYFAIWYNETELKNATFATVLGNYVNFTQLANYINQTTLYGNITNWTATYNSSYLINNTNISYINVSNLTYAIVAQLPNYVNFTNLANYVNFTHLAYYANFTTLANYVNQTTLYGNITNWTATYNSSYLINNTNISVYNVTGIWNFTNYTQLAYYVNFTHLANYPNYTQLAYYVNYTNLANYVNYTNLANYANFTHMATYANKSYVPNLTSKTCPANQHVSDINNATGVVTCTADTGGTGDGYANVSTTTCGGADKVSAINNITGVVTCTADTTGAGNRYDIPFQWNQRQFGYYGKILTTSTTFTAVGMTLPTPMGTATSTNSINRNYIGYVTPASANYPCGQTAVYTLTKANWSARYSTVVRTGSAADLANTRIWVGLTSANMTLFQVNTTQNTTTATFAAIGFQNSSTAGFTMAGQNWTCCSGNGTKYICNDFNMTVTRFTEYTMIIDWTNKTQLNCTVTNLNTSVTKGILVNSTTLYANDSISLGIHNALTTLTATARNWYIGGGTLDQNG